MRKRTWTVGALVLVLVAGLVGAACGRGSGATSAIEGGAAPLPARGGEAFGAPRPVTRSALGSAAARPLAASVPQLEQRIVKTATLDLTVGRGSFEERLQQATQVASTNGGYVSSSETEGRRARHGVLVLRVPAAQFEVALGALRSLGRVSAVRVSGQDVTAQFVDLNARLRNWQAQESVLLGLMRRSTSIADSIRVEQQLQDVQLNIEEITGQLRVLSDQADLSTITVSMSEAGAAAVRPKHESTLSRAWRHAREGFVAVIASVVVGLGYLAPFVVLALLVGLGVAVVRRQRGRITPPQTAG